MDFIYTTYSIWFNVDINYTLHVRHLWFFYYVSHYKYIKLLRWFVLDKFLLLIQRGKKKNFCYQSYVLRAFTSVLLNFLSILHEKTYFFYFTHPFLQNTHIGLSILHIYSIKYSFFYNFLLFLTHYPSLSQTEHYQWSFHTQPPSLRKANPFNPAKSIPLLENPLIKQREIKESQIITHLTWNSLIKQRETKESQINLIQLETHWSINEKQRKAIRDRRGFVKIDERSVAMAIDERSVVARGLMVLLFWWFDQMRKRESEVRVRATRDKEREKKTKILNASAIVTMYICTVTVVLVHLCTILHSLM